MCVCVVEHAPVGFVGRGGRVALGETLGVHNHDARSGERAVG